MKWSKEKLANGLLALALASTLGIGLAGCGDEDKKTQDEVTDILLSEEVRGRVVCGATGQAIKGAKVYIDGDEVATTDSNGRFNAGLVTDGEHVLEVKEAEHKDYMQTITVKIGEELEVLVIMDM